jgi:hypothetical protein
MLASAGMATPSAPGRLRPARPCRCSVDQSSMGPRPEIAVVLRPLAGDKPGCPRSTAVQRAAGNRAEPGRTAVNSTILSRPRQVTGVCFCFLGVLGVPPAISARGQPCCACRGDPPCHCHSSGGRSRSARPSRSAEAHPVPHSLARCHAHVARRSPLPVRRSQSFWWQAKICEAASVSGRCSRGIRFHARCGGGSASGTPSRLEDIQGRRRAIRAVSGLSGSSPVNDAFEDLGPS